MDLSQAPSWPDAEAAKAAWDLVREDPQSSDEDKQTAQELYTRLINKCWEELGMM